MKLKKMININLNKEINEWSQENKEDVTEVEI